jgi:hypothetical protein
MKQLIKINPQKLGLFIIQNYSKSRVAVRHALDELLKYHLQYKVKCEDGHFIDNSLQPRKDVVMQMVDDLNKLVKETINLGDNMNIETWYKFTACVSEWENAQMKDDAGSETQQATKPKPGNVSKNHTFIDCMICGQKEKNPLLLKFHKMIDGRKGRAVAMIIYAGIQAGVIVRPTYKQVMNEFDDIGNRSGYNKYVGGGKILFSEDEIEPIIENLMATSSH